MPALRSWVCPVPAGHRGGMSARRALLVVPVLGAVARVGGWLLPARQGVGGWAGLVCGVVPRCGPRGWACVGLPARPGACFGCR
jgi:hypothetical protein